MGKQKDDKPAGKAAGKGAENIIVSDFYKDIRLLIEEARYTVASSINAAITMLYWQIGKRINEEILKGKRARYGEEIVSSLSRQLIHEYGSGFSAKNLRRMIQFAEVLPIQRDCRIADTTFKLESFVPELGAGFTFIARQKRMPIDKEGERIGKNK